MAEKWFLHPCERGERRTTFIVGGMSNRETPQRRKNAMAYAFKCALTLLVAVAAIAASVAGVHADTPWLSDPDAVQCRYSRHQDIATTSNEAVDAWLDKVASRDFRLPTSKTTVHDSFALDFTADKNYVGHSGRGGGSRIVYDSKNRLLALCQVYDTAKGIFLLSHVPQPPFAIPHGDLTTIATQHGIGLHSSIAAVRAVYGHAPILQLAEGHYGVAYERFDRTVPQTQAPPTQAPFGVYTWFEIANGHVVAIERTERGPHRCGPLRFGVHRPSTTRALRAPLRMTSTRGLPG